MCLPKQHNVASLYIGAALHYLIKQMDLALERHRRDLIVKKPGSLPICQTKLIWSRMVKHLTNGLDTNLNKLFSLRGKFNSILEEQLLDGDVENHHIISIDVPPSGFDLTDKLTTSGMADYWLEINKGLKRFNLDEIKLRPRIFNAPGQKKHSGLSAIKSMIAHNKKLPTPPPKQMERRSPKKSPGCHGMKRHQGHHDHGHSHAKRWLTYDEKVEYPRRRSRSHSRSRSHHHHRRH